VLETVTVNASDRTTHTMRTMTRPSNQVWSCVHNIRGVPPLQLPVYTFKIAMRHGKMVAPPAGLLPLLSLAWGPLSVPCKLGTLMYKHETKVKGRTRYRVLTRVLCLRRLPPRWGGLRRYHVSCGPRPSPPAGVGSGADMCQVALEAASQLGWAPVLQRVLRPRILPPCWGGLRHHHVSCGLRPCLPTRVGSGTTTCPMAPDPASLLGWAPVPPRVLRPRTLLPY
jgi:hypothetical protein